MCRIFYVSQPSAVFVFLLTWSTVARLKGFVPWLTAPQLHFRPRKWITRSGKGGNLWLSLPSSLRRMKGKGFIRAAGVLKQFNLKHLWCCSVWRELFEWATETLRCQEKAPVWTLWWITCPRWIKKQFKAYKRIRGVLQAVSGVFILLMFQVTSSKVSEDQITVQKLLVACDRVKPEGIAWTESKDYD